MAHNVNFRSRSMVDQRCFGLNIQRAARSIAKKFDDAFRPMGLNHWQFGMLMTLNVPNGLSVSELAELLVVDRTTVTANVKPLERAGLLYVAVDKDDARSRRIELTDTAVKLLEAAFPVWERVNDEIERAMGHEVGQTVLGGLASIRNA